MKNPTKAERTSERELVITRTFDAPRSLVFEAWTQPDLLKQWWAPRSMGMTLVTCHIDLRAGGKYRFEFARGTHVAMAFFGHYVEVTPPSRLVWTNEESAEGAVSTLTFEEKDGRTLMTLHELYPTKEALDATMAGMGDGMAETLSQLDELLLTRGASPGRS